MASSSPVKGEWTGPGSVSRPDAKILPIVINVASDSTPKAIRYAVDHDAKVISISQGFRGDGTAE